MKAWKEWFDWLAYNYGVLSQGRSPLPLSECTDFSLTLETLLGEERRTRESVEIAVRIFVKERSFVDLEPWPRYFLWHRFGLAIHFVDQMRLPIDRVQVVPAVRRFHDERVTYWLLSTFWLENCGWWLKLGALYLTTDMEFYTERKRK